MGVGIRRTVVDVMRLRASFLVLERLVGAAPGLVVGRGSAAVFAHAPSIARVPNDLDIFWLGDCDDVPALVHVLVAANVSPGRLESLGIRNVPAPDPRLSALHRVDLMVWFDSARPSRPAHRFWLDISTSRHVVPSLCTEIDLPPDPPRMAAVVPVALLLAEKLWVYVQSSAVDRTDLRWIDLFDMIVMIMGSSSLARQTLASLSAECDRYFTRRDGLFPPALPVPPREWASSWFRLYGPVARNAPTLAGAFDLIRTFWEPVLQAGRVAGSARWDAEKSRWT